jgi:hypothetical protein
MMVGLGLPTRRSERLRQQSAALLQFLTPAALAGHDSVACGTTQLSFEDSLVYRSSFFLYEPDFMSFHIHQAVSS